MSYCFKEKTLKWNVLFASGKCLYSNEFSAEFKLLLPQVYIIALCFFMYLFGDFFCHFSHNYVTVDSSPCRAVYIVNAHNN